MIKIAAVMQPYLFPYVGYFQLLNSCSDFVFYDDVNYIKQGWINRNAILQNGKANLFTVPLTKPSSFSLIKEISINQNLYPKWKSKFIKSLKQSYGKSPYYNQVYPMIEFLFESDHILISELAMSSVQLVAKYLDLKTCFYQSSNDFAQSKDLKRSDRLIAICKEIKAEKYINVEGGRELYDFGYFKSHGIDLQFIQSKDIVYPQGSNEFIPSLSIIDVLMNNPKEEVLNFLEKYTLSQ